MRQCRRFRHHHHHHGGVQQQHNAAAGTTTAISPTAHHLGGGNYSRVIRAPFEGAPSVVKAIQPYTDRLTEGDGTGGSSKRRRRQKQAESEQRHDIRTEICLLSHPSLVGVAAWRWRPDFYASVVPSELGQERQGEIVEAVGFTPCVLLYMEELEIQLDQFVMRSCRGGEGVREAQSLLCDLFAVIVGLARHGIRHNDCMMRNVMLRRRQQQEGGDAEAEQPPRTLLLGSDPTVRFSWPASAHYELVVIDFGLASASRTSPVAGVALSHEARDKLYQNPRNGVSLSRGVHPLEMDAAGFARGLVDLQCLSFSLQGLMRCGMHDSMTRWCRQATVAIQSAQREADLRQRPADLEAVVATLMPPVATREVVGGVAAAAGATPTTSASTPVGSPQ